MNEKNETICARIERVKQKIAAKQIRLNYPLSQDEITHFEAQNNIYLPEAYRQFLLKAGDGGAGPPDYGLVPLASTVCEQFGQQMRADARKRFRPDLAFPLSDTWIWEDDEVIEGDETFTAIFEHGHLYLGTEGCAEDWLLIVTGKERGNVWNRVEIAARPCIPRRDFLSWYEYWLDGRDDWFSDREQ